MKYKNKRIKTEEELNSLIIHLAYQGFTPDQLIKETRLIRKHLLETIPVDFKESCIYCKQWGNGKCKCDKQSKTNKVIEKVNFANYKKGYRDVDIEIMIENKLNEIISYLMENK